MKPLAGIRIVSLEQYGAGPYATLHLADLGAEVIKIEDPRVGGDVGRTVPPFQSGSTSLFFETFNRNKQSLLLDIEHPEGRAVFEDLVRVSQVVFSNLRGDVAENLGLTYEQLAHLNPAIVCCALSGYGRTGPRSADPGYDYMLQALCGWMALTGEPDGPPTKSGLSLVDYAGGIAAGLAMVAAVRHAERSGIGADIDMSLYDTAIGLLNYVATWQLSADYETGRTTTVPIRRWCRSRHSRPAMAGSWSGVPRRSSGSGWPRQWAGLTWRSRSASRGSPRDASIARSSSASCRTNSAAMTSSTGSPSSVAPGCHVAR